MVGILKPFLIALIIAQSGWEKLDAAARLQVIVFGSVVVFLFIALLTFMVVFGRFIRQWKVQGDNRNPPSGVDIDDWAKKPMVDSYDENAVDDNE